MANPEHVKILKKGVEEWNKWRKENRDIMPDLSRADFVGAHLSYAKIYEANLSKADLFDAEFFHTNLSEANLSGAFLFKANLSEADLSQADLYKADSSFADFSGSNLSTATLEAANFHGSNLTNANLTEAELDRTNFSEAHFLGTVLTGSVISKTIFAFTSLETCIGLESVKVQHACSIDFETLKNSPDIPKSFLSKIGLPETYIENLPEFYHEGPIKLFPVFLSHAWHNKNFAGKLYEALIKEKVRVWYDEKDMAPGTKIIHGIDKGISLYDKMILVCSKESLNSWWVEQEITRILEKERDYQKETGKNISLLIPISIDDEIYKKKGGFTATIRERIIADFTDWETEESFSKALKDLINGLKVDPLSIDPPSYL